MGGKNDFFADCFTVGSVIADPGANVDLSFFQVGVCLLDIFASSTAATHTRYSNGVFALVYLHNMQATVI